MSMKHGHAKSGPAFMLDKYWTQFAQDTSLIRVGHRFSMSNTRSMRDVHDQLMVNVCLPCGQHEMQDNMVSLFHISNYFVQHILCII